MSFEKILDNISDWSYRRFGLFFKKEIDHDPEFDQKINIMIDMIKKENITDIEEIAKAINCSLDDCLFKIQYLKNKKLIDEYSYVDKINNELKRCNEEDAKLLDKYSSYLYGRHFSIDEIVSSFPQSTLDNKELFTNIVYNDLVNLEKKGLLNGISINHDTKEITYYTIEKHNKEKEYLTISCPNCKTLNEINIGTKSTCKNCNTEIDGTNEELINYVRTKKDIK